MATKKKSTRAKAKTKAKSKVTNGKSAPAIKEPFTKSMILSTIAENTGLGKKDVTAVLNELSVLVERHVRKRAAGSFTLPGLLKIKTVLKPARKAKKNVPNPFKPGEFMDIKARPASIKVKILPLKALKEMVN